MLVNSPSGTSLEISFGVPVIGVILASRLIRLRDCTDDRLSFIREKQRFQLSQQMGLPQMCNSAECPSGWPFGWLHFGWKRAIGAVASAAVLHTVGHRFESCIAHHLFLLIFEFQIFIIDHQRWGKATEVTSTVIP